MTKDYFTETVLSSIWEIPPAFIREAKISPYFLLKWHRDYLRDKIHTEIDLVNSLPVPYIYRDQIKFYIHYYDGAQLGSSELFWLSFRKQESETIGFVLIKKARKAGNINDNSI